MANPSTGSSADFPLLYRGVNFKLFHQTRRNWRKVFVQYHETTASLKITEQLSCNCLEVPTQTVYNIADLQSILDQSDVNGCSTKNSMKKTPFALHFDKKISVIMRCKDLELKNTWLHEMHKMKVQREYMIDGTVEVFRTFLKYSSDGVNLSLEDFLKFLRDAQKMDCNFDDMIAMLKQSFSDVSAQISYRTFKEFLLSANADIVNPEHRTLHQDMTLPLTDYFISSSHNTYLLEDQLFGPSDCIAYKKALLSGCRCVELDIWNGPDNEPIIYHGHTLTSKVLFKDVCNTIKENAFTTSPYPVILSLENHCSVEQQKIMADHMKNVFGDALYLDNDAEFFEKLPSPSDLKGKIIIKGKKCNSYFYKEGVDEDDVSEEDEAKEIPSQIRDCLKNTNEDNIRLFIQNAKNSSITPQVKYSANSSSVEIDLTNSKKKVSQEMEETSSMQENHEDDNAGQVDEAEQVDDADQTDPTDQVDGSDDDEQVDDADQTDPADQVDKYEIGFSEIELAEEDENNKHLTIGLDVKGRPIKLHTDLSDLVTICRSVKFKGFENRPIVTEMISLSENDMCDLISKNGNALVKHTQLQLVRIYPAGYRVDSSNYYPTKAWISGSQLVALNFQTPTTPMHLNQSLFLLNGRCGYVLKPDFLRRSDTKFSPDKVAKSRNDLHVSVQIISGYKLYRSNATTEKENVFSRYIKVHIFGVTQDEYEAKSAIIQDNGFNPCWQQTFQTDVSVPQVAFLRICVKEDTSQQGHLKNLKRHLLRKIGCQADEKLIGHFTCPLASVQPGYRFVPLMDNFGKLINNARLFVHITFNE